MDTKREKRVHKLVLTGGPCGGKTTGQSRLSTFFENLGWKVFRVPETATVLLSGGIKFSDLSKDEAAIFCLPIAFSFQENLLRTMIQIENTFFELGKSCQKDCLIICDRGAMDASAFISIEQWERMMSGNNWNNVDLRDTRYNHIVHMVSAANGAENFYVTEDHACRSEGVELARELDLKAAASWIGHPYFDVIDNSTDFESKIKRMIACVCQKVGLDTGDRLLCNSKKLKFLVSGPLPADSEFPPFQDFDVVHNYLQSANMMQARLRKRGQNNHWSYIHTIRRPQLYGQSVEVKTQLTHRDYNNMETQKDDSHFTIYKKRRCFIINNQYYQLDIYTKPCHSRCDGLMLLETYSAHEKAQLLDLLPNFLKIVKEVTGEPKYSMFNLSLKADWKENQFGQDRITNGIFEEKRDAKPTSVSSFNGEKILSDILNLSPSKMTNGENGIKKNGIIHNSPNNGDVRSASNVNGEKLVNGNSTSPSKNMCYDESFREQNSNSHSADPKTNGSLYKKLSPTKENGVSIRNGRN